MLQSIAPVQFLKSGAKNTLYNRLHHYCNRLHLYRKWKISFLRGKFLINHFSKHLMIKELNVHEIFIKSRVNNSNQPQFARSKDQATRIIKGSHCRRWKWRSTMVKWKLPLQIWKFFKLTSRSTLQSLDLQELMKKTSVDEGLAQS
jgi:hypothetical protein